MFKAFFLCFLLGIGAFRWWLYANGKTLPKDHSDTEVWENIDTE